MYNYSNKFRNIHKKDVKYVKKHKLGVGIKIYSALRMDSNLSDHQLKLYMLQT